MMWDGVTIIVEVQKSPGKHPMSLLELIGCQDLIIGAGHRLTVIGPPACLRSLLPYANDALKDLDSLDNSAIGESLWAKFTLILPNPSYLKRGSSPNPSNIQNNALCMSSRLPTRRPDHPLVRPSARLSARPTAQPLLRPQPAHYHND